MTDNTDKPRCWAYNKEGQRCEFPAGHSTNHVILTEWGDDECYSPIKHQLPTVTTTPIPAKPLPPVTTIDHDVCVACKHRHRGKECQCDCREFIG